MVRFVPLGPRRFYRVVVVCTLAGLLTGYLFSQQRQRRASDRAIARADSLEVAIRDSSAAWSRRYRDDSLMATRDAERLVRAATLRQQAARAGLAATRLTDTLFMALPDTLRPVLARWDSLHRQETGALRAALWEQDSVIHDLNSRILWRDSVIQGMRSQLEAAMTQLRAALAVGRPRRCGLGATVGYGVQSSGGAVRTGPGVSGGLSCRL